MCSIERVRLLSLIPPSLLLWSYAHLSLIHSEPGTHCRRDWRQQVANTSKTRNEKHQTPRCTLTKRRCAHRNREGTVHPRLIHAGLLRSKTLPHPGTGHMTWTSCRWKKRLRAGPVTLSTRLSRDMFCVPAHNSRLQSHVSSSEVETANSSSSNVSPACSSISLLVSRTSIAVGRSEGSSERQRMMDSTIFLL